MLAAQMSNPILKLFLQQDIDLSNRNKQTLTPLMLAVKAANKDCVQSLLKAGANPRRRNKQGQDAIDLAIDQPEIVSLLEQY